MGTTISVRYSTIYRDGNPIGYVAQGRTGWHTYPLAGGMSDTTYRTRQAAVDAYAG